MTNRISTSPWHTPHQRKVVELVSYGHTAKEVANDLGIATSTVVSYIRTMKLRAQARSLPHLVRLLVEEDYEREKSR